MLGHFLSLILPILASLFLSLSLSLSLSLFGESLFPFCLETNSNFQILRFAGQHNCKCLPIRVMQPFRQHQVSPQLLELAIDGI